MAGGWVYNVGIDIERAERFERIVAEERLRGLFTDDESDYCSRSGDVAAAFAGTWCAKEATVKALAPWVVLDPRRVTVVRTPADVQLAISGWSGTSSGVTVRVTIADRRPIASAFAFASGPAIDG
jgi:phosphopantetheine--protein transferase-like protein